MVNDAKGVALVATLFFILLLLALSSVVVLTSVTERQMIEKETLEAKLFYVSEAGVNYGIDDLDRMINTDLKNEINGVNPQVVANKAGSYVSMDDALGFLVEFAVDDQGDEYFILNEDETEAKNVSSNTALGDGSFQYDIIITQKGSPVTITTDEWDFIYNYRIESSGTFSNLSRKLLLSGDFSIRVQRDNFAKFALFTDHHSTPGGSTVWFTDKTNFAGPIHTNDRYSFAFNPSGIFDGDVSQQNSKGRFYNSGSPVLLDENYNGTTDVPVFNSTYQRSADLVNLESAVQKSDVADQAKGGETITGNGIFLPNDGAALTGGIFVRGNPTVVMGVDGSDNATYTITEDATIKTITVDRTNNQTIISQAGEDDLTYSGLPDGVDDVGTILYVDGTIPSLSGTVQKDTEVTVSSEFDIVISNDITYSSYTSAIGLPGDAGYVQPHATGETNLLGIISWGGDVRIGTSAPDNLNIHGILMARSGIFTVDNYTDQGVGGRGTNTLLGGVITQFYGAFGLFNGQTKQQLSGYGRNFIYDTRALDGKSPPYFPSLKIFTAFSNDLTDKIVWQQSD